MAQIVFVHGIANEQYTAIYLENEWRGQLAGAVGLARPKEDLARRIENENLAGGITCRMAAYGHLFLKPGIQGVNQQALAANPLAEGLAETWLSNVAERSRDEDDKDEAIRALQQANASGRVAQGKGAVVSWAIRHVTNVRWFAKPGFGLATFAVRALDQVTSYLEDPKIRPVAQEAVLDLIGPETRVIIAHSLGTVVAWEALQRRTERPNIRLFVTLGSPLGLRNVIYDLLTPQPQTFPPKVERWVNIADRDDMVAADPNLGPLFPGGKIEGAWTPDNGAEPHNAIFYLGKKMLGEAVAKALEEN
jgi:hypothetical protein